MIEIVLTEKGLDAVDDFILEINAKRKEILDAGIDTADEVTNLPDVDDIINDIEDYYDDEGYCNSWGVTDDYRYDTTLYLERNRDFIVKEKT